MKLGFKDLFKDLTWMQVCAGAVAAATSLFLSSSIGIAGSIIGAAVGSVVTTISSTALKSVLTVSDKAIKQKIGIAEDESGAPGPASNAASSDTGDPAAPPTDDAANGAHFSDTPYGAAETRLMPTPAKADASDGTSADRAAVEDTGAFLSSAAMLDARDADSHISMANPYETPARPREASTDPYRAAASASAPAPLPTSPYDRPSTPLPSYTDAEAQRVRGLAAQRRAKRLERVAVGASLATGLVAVAICALVITDATDGTGIGYRPDPIVQRSEPVESEGATGDAALTADPGQSVTEPTDPSAGDAAGQPPAEGSANEAVGVGDTGDAGLSQPDTSNGGDSSVGTADPSEAGDSAGSEVTGSANGSEANPGTGDNPDGSEENTTAPDAPTGDEGTAPEPDGATSGEDTVS